jgi:hypothetical protein
MTFNIHKKYNSYIIFLKFLKTFISDKLDEV